MSNSIDLDERAHYEPSHLDLCCLQKPTNIAFGSERVNHLYKEYQLIAKHYKSKVRESLVLQMETIHNSLIYFLRTCTLII